MMAKCQECGHERTLEKSLPEQRCQVCEVAYKNYRYLQRRKSKKENSVFNVGWKWFMRAFYTTLALMAVAGFFLMLFDKEPAGAPAGFYAGSGAYFVCQGYVSSQLKNPSSARFPPSESSLSPQGKNTYRVTGYVDATNSFNATVRTSWSCTVRDQGQGNWELVDVNIQ